MSRKELRVKDMINNRTVANKPSDIQWWENLEAMSAVRAAKQRTLSTI